MNLKEKSDEQLRRMLNKNSGLSANQVRSVLSEMKSRGLETPPAGLVTGGRPAKDAMEMSKGGDTKKKKGVPVVTIAVGVGRAQMSGKGKANGKEHKYAAGGSVTDNLPNKGLKKLAATPKGKAAVRKMGFNV